MHVPERRQVACDKHRADLEDHLTLEEGAEAEWRKPRLDVRGFALVGRVLGAIASVLAVLAVAFFVQVDNRSEAAPMGDSNTIAEAKSCVAEAAEAGKVGVVRPASDVLERLDAALSKATDDPRRNFAVNSAWKDRWTVNPPQEKTVYLTFDDGPSSQTINVLNVLDKYHVPATFFVTAQYPESFAMIKEAYSRGHTIALHTFSHDYKTVYASDEAYFADLKRIGDVVAGQIGYVPAFVRLPGGASNTISANYSKGIMGRVTGQLLAKGFQYFDWNTSSGDGSTVTAEQVFDNATKGNGLDSVVLLMHDTPAKNTTVEALPRVIEFYQSQGYSFKAIDRNTPITHQAVAN